MAWRVNGQFVTAVPTLYKLLAPLQVARLMRIPERYAMFLALPASLLAAYGWATLITNKRLARWSPVLTLLLGVIILFEYQSSPLQSQYTDYDTAVFEQLAAEPGDFAILKPAAALSFLQRIYVRTDHSRPADPAGACFTRAGESIPFYRPSANGFPAYLIWKRIRAG